jgi:hypothetical protein
MNSTKCIGMDVQSFSIVVMNASGPVDGVILQFVGGVTRDLHVMFGAGTSAIK